MSITYHTTLPDWEPGQRDEKGFLRQAEGKAVWSNENPPPPIGGRVRVRVNGIGMATVTDYFVQDEFLGVKLLVDKWPDLLKQQNGADRTCHAFGAEID